MTSPTSTPPTRTRRRQTWEGVFSLIRTLAKANDVREVGHLALLTVAGQLLVRRAALFIQRGDSENLELCAALGVRPEILREADVSWDPRRGFGVNGGRDGIPAALERYFGAAAMLTNDDHFVGILLLGDPIAPKDFDELDRRLLETIGMVIGTTLQKVMLVEKIGQANRRLEDAEQLRQSVVDHVSHEFNTPLLIMKETVELLPNATDEMRSELYDMQREAVDRLQQLVHAVLLFSRTDPDDAGDDDWMSLQDLQVLVLRPILHRLSADIPCYEYHRAEPGLGLRVDSSRLQYALNELVRNAVAFGRPEHPWVVVNSYATEFGWWRDLDQLGRVACYRKTLFGRDDRQLDELCFHGAREPVGGEQAHEPWLVIEVLDSGIGVLEEELDTVFEPFTQGSNSPRRGVRGAGMGLTSCRKIVTGMGGEIRLDSRPGQGTVVSLLLPLRRPSS